ncbi:MAG: glycosyltransferase family 4 protein [Paludibacteraceae bacterium]|nr:glycosyltransferase family 4 protein [Paludibacteraceae bacterium]
MKKVLIVATSRKTRGGVTSVVKAHEQGQQWKDYGCVWVETHIDGNFLVKLWLLIKGFCLFLFKLPSCDLVHIHTSEPPSALRKRIFFMPVARLFRKKVIVHFHSFSPETTIRSKYRSLYKYLFEKSDMVVVLSEYWKNEVSREFPHANVKVLYNPCLAEVSGMAVGYANYNGPLPEKLSILYAGTVNQRKGYADMIKAFAKVAADYPKWQIVFAGNGEIEHGQLLAKQLGIEKQTVWLGWVSGVEKDKAFRDSMIFCLPSYAEGFPMSVLDAWSYGLPVITTPVGGIPDVAVDGENMLLFNPGDVDSLAGCMKQMMDDEMLRKKISNASVEFSKTTFNIDTINRQLGDLYKMVIN